MDFIYINSKQNRQRLVKTLLALARSNSGLIPFLARIVAVLEKGAELGEIAEPIMTSLDSEFKFFVHPTKRDLLPVEVKLRNAKFIGELTKFSLCPASLTMSYWHRCLQNFSFHCVEMLCCMIDTCGRFLFRSSDTHAQTETLLDTMWRLKSAKHLAPNLEALVDNAYYLCKPIDSGEFELRLGMPPPFTPVQQFLRHLLYHQLNASNFPQIAALLLKFPPHLEGFFLSSLSQIQAFRYGSLDALAKLLGYLTRFSAVPMKFVDGFLFDLSQTLSLDALPWEDSQLLFSKMKLLGALYASDVIHFGTVLSFLYLLLGNPNPQLRLVSALLTTVAPSLNLSRSGHLVESVVNFTTRLQYTVLCNPALPLDLEYSISDALDSLPFKITRYPSLELARVAYLACPPIPDFSLAVSLAPQAPPDASAAAPLPTELDAGSESEDSSLSEGSDHEASDAAAPAVVSRASEQQPPAEPQEGDALLSDPSLSSEDEEDELSAEVSEEELEESDSDFGLSDEEVPSRLLAARSEIEAEEMQFDKMFDQMCRQGLDQRRQSSTSALHLPENLHPFQTDSKTGDSSGEMKFSLLLRNPRAGKRDTVSKVVAIPADDPLATGLRTRLENDQQERDRLKRFVLEYHRSDTS